MDNVRRVARGARKGFVQAALLLGLLVCCTGCRPRETASAYLTFPAVRDTFSVAEEAEGTLEARAAYVLVAPNIRWNDLEVARLAPEGSAVARGDTVVRFASDQLQKGYLEAIDELALARAEAGRKEAELAMQRLLLESELRSSEAVAEIARLQNARLAFAAPRLQEIQKLEMEASELEARKVRGRLSSLEAIQKEDRAHAQLKVRQAESKVGQARAFLERLVLTAPVDGIALYERNWRTGNKVQEGDAMYAGMPVLKIPDLSTLQIALQVGEVGARHLKVGQKATVTVSSPGGIRLSGKVSRIASVAKPVRRGSRVKSVEVAVELDSTRADLVPGLTAQVRIVTEEVLDALSVPLECVFQQDSASVVYALDGDGFVACRVTVVRQGADFAVVEGNLKGGERLALRQPAPPLVRQGP